MTSAIVSQWLSALINIVFISHHLFIGDTIMVANAPIMQQANPLASFMRQPKIYIRLPSNGEYWPTGTINISESGDYPVYSMTAKDELMLKVPDAVMSGQAVVDVIQHCVPNIKNAWHMPNIDLDVVLIAIRIATYGEKMITPITFGEDIEMEYTVDLRTVMDSLLNSITWDPVVQVNDNLTVFVRPMTYKQISESALTTFETQKIMQVVNNDKLEETEKLKLFKESFSKLTDITLGMVQSSIIRIDSSEGSTDSPKFINEFIENVDKDIFNIIQEHLDRLRELNTIKPVTVQITDEMREKGFTGNSIEVPMVFDPATFFA